MDILSEVPEVVTLFLNRYSNNFSQNWGLTIFVGVVYSLIAYFLFLRAVGYGFDLSKHGVDAFIGHLTKLPDFIIPSALYFGKDKYEILGRALGLQKEWWQLKFGAKVLIFFNDLFVIPYLIFQGVSAFRKH